MGITKKRGWFYWVKRIPKRYHGHVMGADGAPVQQVQQALHTQSRAEALTKAAYIENERLAEWEARLAGNGAQARSHYAAAVKLAAARGYRYIPMADLAASDVGQITERLLSLSTSKGLAPPETVRAVLGAVPATLPTLPEVLLEYIALTETRHTQKSESQKHKWKLPRNRAVSHFMAVTNPKAPGGKYIPVPVNDITRDDVLKFRKWWTGRVADGMKIESANKDFGHLSEIIRTWSELTGVELDNPFLKARLEGSNSSEVPPFSRKWVSEQLLRPGALDRMNEDARDIWLVMFNTALRPSEITDASPSSWHLDAEIPHIEVKPDGKELKVAHTRRAVPLLGVSLKAARRITARGGVTRYYHKAGGWSAVVSKYIRENNLKESPKHVPYSIRHYVEDALLAAGVDDRIRADILGHKYARPRYGNGGALEGRRGALKLIAL